MANIPFLIVMQEALAANATGTLSYQVATNEEFTIKEWRQVSTGSFNIRRIYDSRGFNYSNATANEAISQAFMADAADQNNGLKTPPLDLVITGGSTIYFDVIDTSGAPNTVTIVLSSIRKTAQ